MLPENQLNRIIRSRNLSSKLAAKIFSIPKSEIRAHRAPTEEN
jgi:hypothetical protein